jgi:flagellar basal-body rod modification protein FlgD
MLTSTNNINSSSAATSALTASTGTATKQTDAAASQDRFLKLLVAQLNNQDPMNPMDNAQMTSQMAQINTVSGIQQLNASITSMAAQFTSLQMMQGAGMIGHEILTDGNALSLGAGVGKGGVDLGADASAVTVKVFTPGGQLLDTLNLGAMSAGRHNFDWDASKYSGSGNPTFQVTAVNGKSAVGASTLGRDTIASVSTDAAGAMSVTLKGGASVKYDAIKAIL